MSLMAKLQDTKFEYLLYPLEVVFVALDWLLDKYFIFMPFIGGPSKSWKDLVTNRVTRYKYEEPKGSLRNKLGVEICRYLDRHDYRGVHCKK